jgi:hypothetical protein
MISTSDVILPAGQMFLGLLQGAEALSSKQLFLINY